jgi:8-oxo-dGTP pyrophosphatase MutT (NUDIX family)
MKESRLSCGVVLVRQADSGWVTLMLRAYRHWDFPKGIRERGEEPIQAAKREVAEETGITELQFHWGDRYFETGPYSPETGEPEHSEWRWVSFDEAYDLGSPRVRQIVQWARQILGT